MKRNGRRKCLLIQTVSKWTTPMDSPDIFVPHLKQKERNKKCDDGILADAVIRKNCECEVKKKV